MVRDAQIDPLSRRLVHVDFLRVDLDSEVHVTVPLVLTGKAVGVTNGGNLHQSLHVIPIAAKPAAIPTKLEVDVTAAGHRRRAPRQRPQAGRRACARCSIRATPSRRSWRRRPRRSRPRRRRSRARCRPRARRRAPAAARRGQGGGRQGRRPAKRAPPLAKRRRRREVARTYCSAEQRTPRMWLVVGLGNPARSTQDNRHNVGFMVVDELAARARRRLAAARQVRRRARRGHAGGRARPSLQADGVHERQRTGGRARGRLLEGAGRRRRSSCTTSSTCRSGASSWAPAAGTAATTASAR